MSAKKPRPCIVCEVATMNRCAPHGDPRCRDWLPCALRRNASRARPKPEGPIIEEAIKNGFKVAPELRAKVKPETAERDYILTKLRAGDYLLPSNDAQTLWRINTYEDGRINGLERGPVGRGVLAALVFRGRRV